MTDPPELDPELWVRLVEGWTPDPQLRWFVFGNAHTFPGRFHVCSETGDLHRTVDLVDCAEVSPKAQVWLAGFLAGQEAGVIDYFGSDELEEDATDEDYERWREWNRRFRETGRAPLLNPLPPADPALSLLAPPAPWCYVGERFRVWLDGAWALADPQPRTDTPWFWPGTACEAGDDGHDEDRYGEVYVCLTCHGVS